MESLSVKEENIINKYKKSFQTKKGAKLHSVRDIRNLFRLEKETKAIKDIIIRDVKNPSELEKEEENYYKPVRIINFWSNCYIEYKTNSDRI